MGSTYLTLTNNVLRRFSDVELNSSNFASATAYHAYVKDVVNNTVRQIEQSERQWPFNHQEYTETLALNTREYALPSVTDGDAFDTEEVDWESFFLVKDDALDPPIKEKKLIFLDYDEYMENYRAKSYNVDTSISTARVPTHIYRAQSGKWGVQLPPDKLYQVRFECWGYPSALSAHDDTTTIPSRFDWIINYGCFAEVYAHRGDKDNSRIYKKMYEDGVDNMKELLQQSPEQLRDGRVGNAG